MILSNRTLKLIAIYGGVASLGGSIFLATRIYGNFHKQDFYTEPLRLFNNYPHANEVLGKPITIKRLDLGDPENNYTDGLAAKVTIPLKGRVRSGLLYAWSSRASPTDSWRVDKCDMEVSGKQWTFYINPKSSGIQKTVFPEGTEAKSEPNITTDDRETNLNCIKPSE